MATGLEEYSEMVRHTRRAPRTATALAAVTLLLSGGCSAILNPELAGMIGGADSAVASSTNIDGYILVVLNNLTGAPISASYELDIDQPGPGEPEVDNANQTTSIGVFAMSHHCNVTEIRFLSITAAVAVDTTDGGDIEDIELDVPTTVFSAPALQCGSVIMITVAGFGAEVFVDMQLIN